MNNYNNTQEEQSSSSSSSSPSIKGVVITVLMASLVGKACRMSLYTEDDVVAFILLVLAIVGGSIFYLAWDEGMI